MITEEGVILKGAEVVDYLVNKLPGVSKFAWLLDSDKGQKAKEYFYEKVEELREITRKKNEENCNSCPRK
jgi:hypothetical protein